MAIKNNEAKPQIKLASGKTAKPSIAKRDKAVADDRTGLKSMNKNNSYFASFPELNVNPILEVDREGRLEYQNPMCKRAFPDIGTLGLKHPLFSDWPKVLKELQATNPGQPVIRELLVGNTFYEQAYFTINKDRIRIYGRDITKRKKVEQSLRVAEENLRKLTCPPQTRPVIIS